MQTTFTANKSGLRIPEPALRLFVRELDHWLRALQGVYEFSTDPQCLLRLSVERAPHILRLPDGEIEKGAPTVDLHLWNEHIPRIPAAGPDFGWALRVHRMLKGSLKAVATELQSDPRLAGVKAIGGANALILPGNPGGGEGLMKRLGFMVTPYRHPLGRFGEFWENSYSWLLMWTFNAASLRGRSLLALRRSETWMSRVEFLRRYGAAIPVRISGHGPE